MAMRCFGRALCAALDTRPLDLIALRAVGFAAVLWPVHFFRTAVLAAGLDTAFLAMACLPVCRRPRRGRVQGTLPPFRPAAIGLESQCKRKTPSTARSS